MSLLNENERLAMWLRQEKLCPLCEQAIPEEDLMNSELVNVDHDVPRAHGGSDEISNLQLVHEPCNQAKGCGCQPLACQVQAVKRKLKKPKRQQVWREQNHQCFACGLLILPMESMDVNKSLLRNGRLYCYRCKEMKG